ncbi:MAG TPA: type IV toxin-antitoxin system AbiEi family antitoxin domain-containing protein [Candidatus Binataceae bacterium]|nr:type IV toxin-antitoxin system AbiEi family antitoxin domain-containing protein [Candidatus Binataceae bacterium]HYB89699.1 type IV toxin-antitoxin system AbiEi family antitoxin domain-containing protein [Candidatus Binataceae bacterium]
MPAKPKPAKTQQDRAVELLHERGMLRLAELRRRGITAATVARLERRGEVVRLARGLYQLPDASLHAHHALAEAAKLVPKGVVCLVSALAFHQLTDQVPSRVWIAIGRKDWRPRGGQPPMRFVRFPRERLQRGVEIHEIEGVRVPVFGAAKTLADLFRYRRVVGTGIGVEGIREALRQRKVTPAQISEEANRAGVWKAMQPYLEALV